MGLYLTPGIEYDYANTDYSVNSVVASDLLWCPEDDRIFCLAAVSGVILFQHHLMQAPLTSAHRASKHEPVSRNLEDIEGFIARISAVNANRVAIGLSPLDVCCDLEGGLVQRYIDPTFLPRQPSHGQIGQLYQKNQSAGCQLAYDTGYRIGMAASTLGIATLLAPVVDVFPETGSSVLSGRCFSSQTDVVVQLACAWIRGALAAGRRVVLKHAPGHGGASADTHTDFACCNLTPSLLLQDHFGVFLDILRHFPQQTDRVLLMVNHVCYTGIDAENVASCSVKVAQWMQDHLHTVTAAPIGFFTDCMRMHSAYVMQKRVDQNDADAIKAAVISACRLYDAVIFSTHQACPISKYALSMAVNGALYATSP